MFFRVSPTGSDAAAGTFQAPWQTLEHLFSKLADDTVTSGSIVVIDPGVTYDLSSGTTLTLSNKSYASRVKIIMGGGGLGTLPRVYGDRTQAAFLYQTVDNLFLGDFEVDEVLSLGSFNSCNDIILHGLHIHDIENTGILVGAHNHQTNRGRDLIVEHCLVEDSRGDGMSTGTAIRTIVRFSHFRNHGIQQNNTVTDAVAFHGVKQGFAFVLQSILENVEGKAAVGTNFFGSIVTVSGVNIAFDSTLHRIVRASGSWSTSGLAFGEYVRVTGSVSCNGVYRIEQILTTTNPNDTIQISTAAPAELAVPYATSIPATVVSSPGVTVARVDGAQAYTSRCYIRNASTGGLNALEPLSKSVSDNCVIITPAKWFGNPFSGVQITFTTGANTIQLLGGASWSAESRFVVGDLFEIVSATNPANNGLYKIASFSTTVNPNDTVTVATAAPGVTEISRNTSVAGSTVSDATAEVRYLVAFRNGVSGAASYEGRVIARNLTVINRSKDEAPATGSSAVSSFGLIGDIPYDGLHSIKNNISVCEHSSAVHVFLFVFGGSFPLAIDYNCYWPITDDGDGERFGVSFNASPYARVDLPTWQAFLDLNSFGADPMFVGDPTTDPRGAMLLPGSPCIGAGIDMSEDPDWPVLDDYRGHQRDPDSWDIGAFQIGEQVLPSYRTNRSGARMEFQIEGSGCVGLRFSVTYEDGEGDLSAGIVLYRIFKPADYVSDLNWRSVEVSAGVVILDRLLDPDSVYFVEVLVGRLADKVFNRIAPSNVERFREPEDNYGDFGPSGNFVEVQSIVVDAGTDIRPIDWDAAIADPFNVLLIGNSSEDGVVTGQVGEQISGSTTTHYAAIACAAVADSMTDPRRLNLLTSAYDDQRILELQFPHVFSDGTTVESLADYKAGIGINSLDEIIQRSEHQDDPGSVGALFGQLTLLRSYEPDPHLVIVSLGIQDMLEYDPNDGEWEQTAITALRDYLLQIITDHDHVPRIIVTLPVVTSVVNSFGVDPVRFVITEAVQSLYSTPYNFRTVDVQLVDLRADIAGSSTSFGLWGSVLTKDQHEWLARDGGAFRTAVQAAFVHVL